MPAPAPRVLAAFGVAGQVARRLPGGQGGTWRTGEVVLKPVGDAVDAEWAGALLDGLVEDGFRVNRPVRSRYVTWAAHGWSAWRWLPGVHDLSGRWSQVLQVAAALNAALAGVPGPSFLEHRDNVWSRGDRVAWDDAEPVLQTAAFAPYARRYAELRTTTSSPSQLIHGDLAGNVLFADPLRPAVIDFAPYWRPPEFALAIVAADAIAWYGAGPELLDELPGLNGRSLVARAALYRLVTSDLLASDRITAGRADRHATYVQRETAAHDLVIAALDG